MKSNYLFTAPLLLLTAALFIFSARSFAMKESDKIISLPAPSLKGEVSLEETLNLRRSVRSFSQDSLTLEQVSQVLWAGQGITGSSGKRTAPSAGALYPMELYIIVERVSDLKPGCYHYNPHKHQLELAGAGARLNKLAEAALGQSAIKDCAMAVLITAVFERTSVKYGERAERYVWIEAGHIAQNILLQAAALNLGAVPMGAFYDDRVKKTLKLKEEPLYIIPVGGKE